MNPGKRFEDKFRESLDLLPGFGMRIIDGGDRLKERMPADFWYFPTTGGAYLIECKAVMGKSLPIAKVTQLPELLRFEGTSPDCHALIAVNFYGKNIRKDNRCLLMRAVTFAALSGGKRKSVPLKAFEHLGYEAPRIKGNIWDLRELERI